MNSKTKKILIIVLAACILLSSLFAVWFMFLRAPKLESIYDRVVELVEASYDVNTVFYGAGLPVYRTDSVYAENTQMYFGFQYKGFYEVVTENADYISTLEMMMEAEQVYSKAYLEEVLYPHAFTGYAIGSEAGSEFSFARYYEDEEWIYQSVSDKNYLKGMRVYDYSTMKIAYPSNSKACYVTMDSWLEDTPEKIEKIRLRLVMQDGQWYLDSFSG